VAIVTAIALLAAFPFVGADVLHGTLTKVMILAIFALSLDSWWGIRGLVSFGPRIFRRRRLRPGVARHPSEAATFGSRCRTRWSPAALAALWSASSCADGKGNLFHHGDLAFDADVLFLFHDEFRRGSDGISLNSSRCRDRSFVPFDLRCGECNFGWSRLLLVFAVMRGYSSISIRPCAAGISSNGTRMARRIPGVSLQAREPHDGRRDRGAGRYLSVTMQFGFVNLSSCPGTNRENVILMLLLGGRGQSLWRVVGALCSSRCRSLFSSVTYPLAVLGRDDSARVFLPGGIASIAGGCRRTRVGGDRQ